MRREIKYLSNTTQTDAPVEILELTTSVLFSFDENMKYFGLLK